MGWWPFGRKGDLAAKKMPQSPAEALKEALKPPAQQQQDNGNGGGGGPLAGMPLPKPTSVFEFGQAVPAGGDVMRGMCAGSDPDAIHACAWSVEPSQGKGRGQRAPRYRVEF